MADKKWPLKPEPSKKWPLGPGPLEPMPPGMNCKPWFKNTDKLPSRYLVKDKSLPQRCPTALDSRRWIFVKEGLDDFRRGCPSCEDMITRGPREGFLPLAPHRIPQPSPKKTRIKLPKGKDLYSRLSHTQQARKVFIEEVEASLIKHPLAHYPKLGEDLPADLLLKVLQVLDPDSKLEDAWARCQGTRERKKSPTKLAERLPDEINLELPNKVDREPPCKVDLEPPDKVNLEPPDKVNLEPPDKVYLEPPDKVNLKPPDKVDLKPTKESLLLYLANLFPEEKKEKKSSKKGLPQSPSLYQKAPRVVRKFCKWVNDNFGDTDLDEEYIMKQFEIDHTRPLTHNTGEIKRLSQIPLEVKYSGQLGDIKVRKFSLQEDNWERKLQKPKDPYKPKREKIRYGAWYLDPKSWKKLVNDEPWIDPKILRGKECQKYQKHLQPDILDDLYGPIAFKDFLISKGYKMPGVIENLFLRKGWTYDSVKTPIDQVMKLLSKQNDEAEGED